MNIDLSQATMSKPKTTSCLWLFISCQIVIGSLTHAGGVGPPEDGYALPRAGSAVGDERLTVAVFMDWTLTHICHTRPTEGRISFSLRSAFGQILYQQDLAEPEIN